MKIEVKTKNEWRKVLLLAVKIAVGSSAAIYIAQILGLEYEASAGTIALLTLVTTKWETVRLSVYRLVTFVFSVVLAGITFECLDSEWIAYGVYIFFLFGISSALGWKATISVNAVIGTHFLTSRDFGYEFVRNEFLLVLIGITIAVILNLFHDYRSQREYLIHNMRVTEERLSTLHNLHYEAKRIRMIPAQAQIIADYIRYLSDYVVEHNSPEEQIGKLEQIFIDMKDEPLPESREEFENRAVLYHILMDLEEFLIMKRRFINGLNEKQRELYWKDEKTDKEAAKR